MENMKAENRDHSRRGAEHLPLISGRRVTLSRCIFKFLCSNQQTNEDITQGCPVHVWCTRKTYSQLNIDSLNREIRMKFKDVENFSSHFIKDFVSSPVSTEFSDLPIVLVRSFDYVVSKSPLYAQKKGCFEIVISS
ncbi:hypothetical protein ElyMa_006812000 [Elysia marginata]|uniref:Uncharacterized protein n=1 Tax=Elysia marginata TaxID=1093978 RepID=A0AAV4J528_9GAST|nr:hypothetical protein ElyMa_006812000 [Elysia marginata]